MGMVERQQLVCAIALFADGWSYEQIAKALDVEMDDVTRLVGAGAEEQDNGTMGHMKNCPAPDNRVVVARNDDGSVKETVPRV